MKLIQTSQCDQCYNVMTNPHHYLINGKQQIYKINSIFNKFFAYLNTRHDFDIVINYSNIQSAFNKLTKFSANSLKIQTQFTFWHFHHHNQHPDFINVHNYLNYKKREIDAICRIFIKIIAKLNAIYIFDSFIKIDKSRKSAKF